jgi:hypothetical protein
MAPNKVVGKNDRGASSSHQQPDHLHHVAIARSAEPHVRGGDGGVAVLGDRRPNVVDTCESASRLAPEARSGAGAAHVEIQPCHTHLPPYFRDDRAYPEGGHHWDLWFTIEHDTHRHTYLASRAPPR